MNKSLLILLLYLPLFSFSQNCDCESTFEWTKKTFEENDAGFEYVINKKGNEAYSNHNAVFSESVKNISTTQECAKLVRAWLSFFRKGHKDFHVINSDSNTNNYNHKHESLPTIDSEQFQAYLLSKENIDYEGIWESEPYTVGVKKIDGIYKGIVMKVSSGSWKAGEVKFYINPDSTGVYYMGDYSDYPLDKIQYLEGHFLNLEGIYFKRIFPKVEEVNTNIDRYIELIDAFDPSIRKVNKETCLLRIPSFDSGQKEAIDDLISKHLDEITSNKNLIIDLRGNVGGANKSYYELLPILYTNPVTTIYWKHLSTQLNNQRWKEWLDNPHLSEEGKTYLTNINNKLNDNLGEFVYIYDDDGYEIFEQDFRYEYPKNIAILVDEDNASATEQFILAAKQSKKVKIFGRTSFGSIDISELNQVQSPDGNFVLTYGITKSLRLPNFSIDGIGIQPDYYLNESIQNHNWIEYVLEVLKE